MDFLGEERSFGTERLFGWHLLCPRYCNSTLPRCASESRHISVRDGADMSTNDAVDVYDTFLRLSSGLKASRAKRKHLG